MFEHVVDFIRTKCFFLLCVTLQVFEENLSVYFEIQDSIVKFIIKFKLILVAHYLWSTFHISPVVKHIDTPKPELHNQTAATYISHKHCTLSGWPVSLRGLVNKTITYFAGYLMNRDKGRQSRTCENWWIVQQYRWWQFNAGNCSSFCSILEQFCTDRWSSVECSELQFSVSKNTSV